MRLIIIFISSILFTYSNETRGQILDQKDKLLIDSLEYRYYNITKSYRDSLQLSTPYIKNLNLDVNPLVLARLEKSLINKDQDVFLEIISNLSVLKVDLRPMVLYMATACNNPIIYSEIYYLTESKSMASFRPIKTFHIFNRSGYLILQNASPYERDLALWSLLKAFQNKDIKVALTLSELFNKGLYFAKNEQLASKLDYIYQKEFYK